MNNLILILTLLISTALIVEIARRRNRVKSLREPHAPPGVYQSDRREDIESILRRHAEDDCLGVNLTAAAPSKLGREELLSLKPGAPLWLEYADHTGMDRVKVYSGGFMIGSILLKDAEKVINVMKNSCVLGSYVAQNNCRPDNLANLRIVVFYEAPECERDTETPTHLLNQAMATPYKITVNLPDSTSLFQN